MSLIEINLIPTSEIYKCKPILDGSVLSNKLQVALGDGFKANNFDPDKLVDELARVDVDAIEFTEKTGDPIYTLKTEVSSQWKGKIKEVGLYFKKPNAEDDSKHDWVLVAYYGKDEVLQDPETLSLRLMLPYKQKPRDTSSGNNPGQKPTLKSSSGSPRLGNVSAVASSLWDDLKEKDYVWSEEYNNEIAIYPEDVKYANEPITNIAASFDGGRNAYLLFKGKNSSNVYVRIYDFPNTRLSDPFFSTEITTLLNQPDGVFGELKQREVKAYVAHPKGVWCLSIDLAGQLRSTTKQQYHPSIVGNDTTVFNLDDNAGLAGGNIAGYTTGYYVSMCGRASEGSYCLGAQSYVTYPRNNPLVVYRKEKIYFIGGNRNLAENAIEIRPITIKSDGNFSYFSHLSPGTIKCPNKGSASDYNLLKKANALTHVSCIIGEKIFIFPRDMFKNEEAPPFFIYDIVDETLSTKYLSADMQEKVNERKIKRYDSFQVVSIRSKAAYFFLTSSVGKSLSTRVISLNINP